MEDDIKQLNKKLKYLQDELEDAEEERQELSKKNHSLHKDNVYLNEELDGFRRRFNIIQQDYDNIKQNLSDTKSKYNLQCEAMDFVTEVLTAKLASDESVDKLYKEVDTIVDFIKDEVRDVLKQMGELSSEVEYKFFGRDLDFWAVTKKKTWIQGKKAIAFVGEFSAGKTSIVNRIISQDNPEVPLLPVSMKATTAIPTYISGGECTYYSFVTPDNELKIISPSTFLRVNKDVLDKIKGVSSMIQYFVMTYKNPHLEKMSILDTPGFSSNDAHDGNRTISVINECDALFWVFDVNTGTVNHSSLKIIKKHLVKPLYIVINKVDTKSKIEVDKVESLIRKSLEDAGIGFKKIVRFSCVEPLEIIMRVIDEVPQDEKRESFMDNLIEYTHTLLKDSAETTKELFSQYNSCQATQRRLAKLFEFELVRLDNDCNQLRDIPKENWRLLGANDYRMTGDSYNKFKNLIYTISEERSDEIRKLYEKQKEVVSELEIAWNKYSDAKKLQSGLKKCLDKLELKLKLISGKSTLTHRDEERSIKALSVNSMTSTNVDPKISMKYFKRYFGGSILEDIDDNLKIRWEGLHSTLEYHCSTKFTKKLLKELIPAYGNKRPVNKYELLKQVSDILDMSKSKKSID